MKLVTFVHDDDTRVGALITRAAGEYVYDLHALDPNCPADMLAFLEGGEAVLARARAAVEAAQPEQGFPLHAVQLKAPLSNPRKIIGIGLNYRDHAAETNAALPTHPVAFAKFSNGLVGHGEPILLPACVARPDYEGELAIVIGKRCRRVAERDALKYVLGYTIANDVSARDWQFRTNQWMLGKSVDTFCPIGPAFVTADEIPNPHALRLRTWLNRELMQDSSTKNLIFGVAHLVFYLAQTMTLEPGDLILSGTPGGVGFSRKPPRLLQPGDVVRIEIEQIGVLENPVTAEA